MPRPDASAPPFSCVQQDGKNGSDACSRPQCRSDLSSPPWEDTISEILPTVAWKCLEPPLGQYCSASKTLKSLQILICWYLWIWVTEIVREEKLTGYQNCNAGLHPQCSSWFFPVGRLTGKISYSLITEFSRKHCCVFPQFITWNGIFMVKQTYTEFEKSNEFLTRNFPIFSGGVVGIWSQTSKDTNSMSTLLGIFNGKG